MLIYRKKDRFYFRSKCVPYIFFMLRILEIETNTGIIIRDNFISTLLLRNTQPNN